ncbi:MAG: GlcNAc-PI de-N-acetylase family [Deltaproteobacteria bacterium]|nr:GlcNAc-PI de-N-acetylase family [Deltaproteobacteria bacterium]
MKNRHVLVISAHPDDVDFGCGGTLARWAREGAKITYCICTSGEKGTDDPSMTNLKLARTREKEQRAAAKVIGAEEVIYLRKPDGELQPTLEFRGELVRVIRQCRPHTVFTHDPANRLFDVQYIFHADHRVVGETAFDAVYPAAGNRNFFPGHLAEGLDPHAVSEIYFFASASPDTWIDVEATLPLKIRALRCHRSQIKNPKMMEEMVRTWFRVWGREKGLAYAERFRRLEIFHDPAQRLKRLKKALR